MLETYANCVPELDDIGKHTIVPAKTDYSYDIIR
ncbi:MAG: hypothetical protein IOMNBAOH_00399 [Rhodocyclaceae bacterium]|nr:hypothetical protein [Rhodocyclaceae bacterium]